MRSIKLAVAVVAVSGLLGCGGSQPSIYRVAMERVTLANTAACFRAGQVPTTNPDETTNMVDEEQWVIWDGIDDVQYLEPGNIDYSLGQAEDISIGGEAIQGGKVEDNTVFTTTRTRRESTTEIYTTSATYTIEKLGKTLEGSLALSSACAGADCGGIPSCNVTLRFVGRKISTDNLTVYDNSGGD
ncbi:hypothetical protein [Hyalangium rubrum]|uniref:Lipoprotein n=1 Tax=Hyalangium rubrum TaxID=3103134 RepID=A0ABU5GXI5_9BACT|nr:hypothetical protein [Hyalangium sp. s54d21]MDY7225900.1 hypothetical protein [Hyalangium sp. s54d21]